MSQPQPQPQGPPAAQQQSVQLLKADDIPKLQCLSNDMKQKYRPIVQNFWTIMQTKPSNGPEYLAARGKLQEWSTKLISQERNHRARLKAAQTQQNQAQGQSAQQSQPGQAQAQVQAQGQPAAQQPAQQQQQQQQQPQPNSQQQSQQQPRPAQPAQQQIAFDPEIIKHVQGFKFFLPVNGPQAGTPEGDAKIKEMRNSYLMALNKQQKATQRIKMLQQMEQSKQQAGQEIPAELPAQRQNMEKEYNTSKEWIDKFRKSMTQNRAEQEQRRNQQQGQAQPQAQQQQQQAQHASQPVKEEPQVKIESGQMPQAPPTQQFANMGAPTAQPPQQATKGPAPSLPQQQQQQQQLPQQQQPMRQPPAPHAPLNQNQPQFAQPGPPQRPPINPHQANSMPQVHQQNNSPHPQSATSNGAPAPLSHSAAVSAAQRSYSNQEGQRTNTPTSGGAQGNFHNPGSREREQLNNPKMPIPRQLPPMATQPVAMGQARPTMSGPTNGAPGPMGQPVISKFPPFQLEGDSDRVLSKRKLDELVRQVTGGSEEALTPEVEEAVLQLADDFVDTVITNACKLSKLRESSQLDVRDIQMVLERSYNIRIPGYASDEVRTVRRLVPAPGWTQKMNAVQAAKVMGGKNDI